jgi:Carboxypeptidase regulatory-like domain/TonB dependent receptor
VLNHTCRWTLFISFAVVASYWCVNPTSLQAQTVSGTILGQIQDQQGAAIGKAEVSARNLETGAIRNATANDSGEYRITSVPAGPYEVSVTFAGFKTEVRSGIDVTVGADVAVNFSLTVGAVSEKVEVTAEAAQVDASSSTLSGFVNSATIGELPLNGRDWLQLALLQPGVNGEGGQQQIDGKRAQTSNGLAISIAGGRPSDNAFRIDGIIVNDHTNGGPGSSLHVNMGVDAIREFSVLTNNYSAEYGRGSGGIINAVTKSGTNQFHGTAYGFVRNSDFDARNFFDAATIAPFHRFQYGGSVGGPIKKDKTFFFTNYEKLGEVKASSTNDPTLSPNARNGIICANTACTSTIQVPIAASVRPFLPLFPISNGPNIGNDGTFFFNPKRLGQEHYVIGKIDHYFSASTTLTGSYTFDNTTVTTPDDYDLHLTAAPTRRQYVALALQHIFSPTLINNTRFGLTRVHAANSLDCCATSPLVTDKALGSLPGQGFGQLIVNGIASGGSSFVGTPTGIGATGANIFGYTAPQVYNDLSWTKGRHNIRMGGNFERIDYNIYGPYKPVGTWNFGSVSDFLQGIPSQFQSDFPGADAYRSERMSMFGAFIQDDFRVLPNLTLNLGVRYEMGTPVTEAHGRVTNLRNLTDPSVTVGDPYYNNATKKNFAPRVGFAWDPFKNGKTAIRGGFGMFDVIPLPYLFTIRMPRSAPLFLGGQINNPPPASFPNQVYQLLTLNTLSAAHIEFNPSRTYKMQWNLNIQRQLTRTLALTVGYVGSAGVHLSHNNEDADLVPASLRTFNTAADSFFFPIPAKGQTPARINPNFGAIAATDWMGHSSYDGLQVNLVQRPVKGLMYQIAYTWSKAIDIGSSTFSEGGETLNNVAAAYGLDPSSSMRGPADFDVPHNLVINSQYELPTPGFVKNNALGKTVLGGWQVGGIYTRQTGGDFSLKITSDQAFTGTSKASTSSGGERPMYVNIPGCSVDAVTGNIGHYINTACFAFPVPGQLGNLGRNTLRMPTFRDLDFSVFKNQNLWGEKLKAQLRIEMFNILNNTNLTPQTQSIFDSKGNLVSNIGTPQAPTTNPSRQIQFGLKLVF